MCLPGVSCLISFSYQLPLVLPGPGVVGGQIAIMRCWTTTSPVSPASAGPANLPPGLLYVSADEHQRLGSNGFRYHGNRPSQESRVSGKRPILSLLSADHQGHLAPHTDQWAIIAFYHLLHFHRIKFCYSYYFADIFSVFFSTEQ